MNRKSPCRICKKTNSTFWKHIDRHKHIDTIETYCIRCYAKLPKNLKSKLTFYEFLTKISTGNFKSILDFHLNGEFKSCFRSDKNYYEFIHNINSSHRRNLNNLIISTLKAKLKEQ